MLEHRAREHERVEDVTVSRRERRLEQADRPARRRAVDVDPSPATGYSIGMRTGSPSSTNETWARGHGRALRRSTRGNVPSSAAPDSDLARDAARVDHTEGRRSTLSFAAACGSSRTAALSSFRASRLITARACLAIRRRRPRKPLPAIHRVLPAEACTRRRPCPAPGTQARSEPRHARSECSRLLPPRAHASSLRRATARRSGRGPQPDGEVEIVVLARDRPAWKSTASRRTASTRSFRSRSS